MPRPIKCRRVEFLPDDTRFVPYGKQKSEGEVISLKIEELEAVRLKDVEELNQEQCAKSMHVSRQTFQNIIDSARKKIAMALIEGKEIRIGGGNFITNSCKLKCLDCEHEYNIKYETDKKVCPQCGSERIVCSTRLHKCRRWCNK